MKHLILVDDPHPHSYTALIALNKDLEKEEVFNWLKFRDEWLRTQRLTCYFCGKKNLQMYVNDSSDPRQRAHLATIDHLIPTSKGGSKFDTTNMVVACSPCNEKKRNNMFFGLTHNRSRKRALKHLS